MYEEEANDEVTERSQKGYLNFLAKGESSRREKQKKVTYMRLIGGQMVLN